MRKQWKEWDFILGGSKITADGDCSHEIKRYLFLGRKAMTNLDSILKSRHYFASKGPTSQSYGFFSSHVWMWELDYKDSWAVKNWCFWTVVFNRGLECWMASLTQWMWVWVSSGSWWWTGKPFHPLWSPPLPSIFPSIRVFSNESILCSRWPKFWNFSFSITAFNEYSGLLSFKIDCFPLGLTGKAIKLFFSTSPRVLPQILFSTSVQRLNFQHQ